ncbi:MAG: CPBP family intramembrane metalloprotease, partial [Spirochaetia bacterium]|nr:CPBP family intramembrane metalloprotease [Spirochaetia bacterium]
LKNISFKYLIANFIQHIYYPSIVEEVIFRGFLLSALLSFNIRSDKANIIQAIIFGFSHMLGYKEITLISFFIPFVQIFIGYLIGKMYLKNKSISSCIILHTLIDTL